ncbi:DUF2147 domain-containing protein [Chitinophaga sp. XS-30]|uniref:DUF2147 domain-containing protein n=1 Tax=Chitinophaga sp. XS-30 TaxID=2604421 RepID=UPI0011DE084F|nr:DUF2147 domain-containing protein [Chitinophaga sp. XS-30]QEH42754.1 DUF2147 domain-containing protein [Chitinophaga sp. XS-30]
MKNTCWLILLFLLPTALFAQQADAITGTWLNEEKDAKVQVYRNGNNYYGKLVWIKDAYEDDGKTLRKDSKNPDAALRNRNLINLVILRNFVFDDGEWTDGKIYDPKSGKTYSSKMKLQGNTLEIRGYVGISMFGRTTVWTKAN